MEVHRGREGSRSSEPQSAKQHPRRGSEKRVSTTRDATTSAEATSACGANSERPALDVSKRDRLKSSLHLDRALQPETFEGMREKREFISTC